MIPSIPAGDVFSAGVCTGVCTSVALFNSIHRLFIDWECQGYCIGMSQCTGRGRSLHCYCTVTHFTALVLATGGWQEWAWIWWLLDSIGNRKIKDLRWNTEYDITQIDNLKCIVNGRNNWCFFASFFLIIETNWIKSISHARIHIGMTYIGTSVGLFTPLLKYQKYLIQSTSLSWSERFQTWVKK